MDCVIACFILCLTFSSHKLTGGGLVACPINSSHILDPKNLEAHIVTCSLRKAGVDPDKVVSTIMSILLRYHNLI